MHSIVTSCNWLKCMAACISVLQLAELSIARSSLEAHNTNMEMSTKGIPLDNPPVVYPQLGKMFLW